MTANNSPTIQDVIRGGEIEMYKHMAKIIDEQGRSIDDAKEAVIQGFMYELEPENFWRKFEQAPVVFYDLTFADKTFHHQYWHFKRNEPLTYEQALKELDLKRFSPEDKDRFARTRPAGTDNPFWQSEEGEDAR